jgi:hypothetical protein
MAAVSPSLAKRRWLVLGISAACVFLLSYPASLLVSMAQGSGQPEGVLVGVWSSKKGYLTFYGGYSRAVVDDGLSEDFTYVYSGGCLSCETASGVSFWCRLFGDNRMYVSLGLNLIKK